MLQDWSLRTEELQRWKPEDRRSGGGGPCVSDPWHGQGQGKRLVRQSCFMQVRATGKLRTRLTEDSVEENARFIYI